MALTESSSLLELTHRPELALFANIDTSSPRPVPMAILGSIQRDADLFVAHLALFQVARWAEARGFPLSGGCSPIISWPTMRGRPAVLSIEPLLTLTHLMQSDE